MKTQLSPDESLRAWRDSPSCPETRSTSSRSLSTIETQQTAEALAAFDLPCPVLIGRRHNEATFETLMRPLVVVVRDVFTNGQSEMRFSE
jgi:hypothetical protein